MKSSRSSRKVSSWKERLNLTGYGAFVDLGGIDGILHISDMSWGRINHPTEIVQVGEKVKVVVLKFDAEKSEFPGDETIDS
jgi:transcriptional accessory protein Tex/SPT6